MSAEKERSEATTPQQARQQVERLVEPNLDLHEKLGAATVPADKELYQRQIEATDAQIDALVYELYGSTEKQIAIVDGWP